MGRRGTYDHTLFESWYLNVEKKTEQISNAAERKRGTLIKRDMTTREAYPKL